MTNPASPRSPDSTNHGGRGRWPALWGDDRGGGGRSGGSHDGGNDRGGGRNDGSHDGEDDRGGGGRNDGSHDGEDDRGGRSGGSHDGGDDRGGGRNGRHGGNPRWLPRSRAGQVTAVAALVVMAGFWIWAFSPLAPSGHPDLLDNVVFTLRAEEVCADALDALDGLPGAAEATSPQDRSAQLATATLLLEEMVGELRTEAADLTDPDAGLVRAWLADWETYLGDRRAYAEVLAGGSDPPFTVTARDGDGVQEYIDTFAGVNTMPSCATPGDV